MTSDFLAATRYSLGGGTVIAVREVVPSDRGSIADGFRRLSSQSRYQRFLAPVGALSEAELDHLVDLDGRDRVAVGAVDVGTGCGIGIARYHRLVSEPAAEMAIAVIDAYQRRGVGTILFDELRRIARRNGIDAFVLEMLRENPARKLLRGLEICEDRAHGAYATVRAKI